MTLRLPPAGMSALAMPVASVVEVVWLPSAFWNTTRTPAAGIAPSCTTIWTEVDGGGGGGGGGGLPSSSPPVEPMEPVHAETTRPRVRATRRMTQVLHHIACQLDLRV